MQTAKPMVLILTQFSMFLLTAFGKKQNFKISSKWAGHSYLYPLLMVIFKAAVKVSRQLGGVDDLRQAL